MRNPAAHAALKRFCQDALAHMREAVPDRGQSLQQLATSFTFSDSGYTATTQWEVNWAAVVRGYLEEPPSIPSWASAVQQVEADGKLSGRQITSEQPWRTIMALLHRLVSKQGTVAFQSELFDAIYQEIEDYFYQDTVNYRYLAPLKRFNMEPDEVPLGPGLSITRIADVWKAEMLREVEMFRGVIGVSSLGGDLQKAARRGHALVLYLDLRKEEEEYETPYRMPGEQHGARNHVGDTFSRVCSALRLFKAGAVGYEQILLGPTSWVPVRNPEVWGGGAPSFIGKPYELSEREAVEFKAFCSSHFPSLATAQDHVALAIRRLDTSYVRGSPGERLIDFMVAFEALLLESEAELRYKLAMRAAVLLSGNADERETIYHELLAAYKERNHIVHGSGPPHATVRVGKKEPKEEVKLEHFNDRIEDRLRAAIKAVKKRSAEEKKEDMIRHLDLQIARGMTSA